MSGGWDDAPLVTFHDWTTVVLFLENKNCVRAILPPATEFLFRN